MRILLLSWNYAPVLGGMEYLITNLFRGLRRAGHDVRLLTTYAEGAEAEEGVERATRKGLAAYELHALRSGWRACRSLRPDVILCGSVVTAPVALLLSRAFRVPFVVSVYGSDLVFDHWLYQRVVGFPLRRADRLVACSRHTMRIAEAAGYDPAKIDVVYPGVTLGDFAADPEIDGSRYFGPTAGRRVLLSVGRLVRRKGILEFVEKVMPRLVEADSTVLYVIVGGDATASLAHRERMSDSIRARVRELGLEDHVRLAGELPDDVLRSLYFQAEIFVLPVLDLPGDVEGFGIVFLEAALAGTPSVATRSGGIPEAVADGTGGLLVEPADYGGLTRAILRLLEDRELRRRYARQARDRARREFGWETITDQHARVLESVARARAAAS